MAVAMKEVVFQTENAVRDYYFTTQQTSTIAVVSLLNAIEQVNNHEYEHLMHALALALSAFGFESYSVLLKARDKLHYLVNKSEEIYNEDVESTTSSNTHHNDKNKKSCYVDTLSTTSSSDTHYNGSMRSVANHW